MTDRLLRLSSPSTDDGETLYSITVDPTGESLFGIIVNEERVQVIAWPDGENAVTLHTMALPDPDEQKLEAAFNRAMEALPETTTLAYVAHDDTLTDEQIQAAFKGAPPWDDANLDEYESEMRHSGMWAVLEDAVDDEDLDLLRKDQGKMDDLMLAVQERDDSNIFDDLARQTPHKWIRYNLAWEANQVLIGDNDEDVEADIVGIAQQAGIELTPENERLIRDLVTEAGGGTVWLLWYGAVDELIEAAADSDRDPQSLTITWENPHLLVLDSYNGSGYDVRFPGTVTLPFDRSRLQLDARGIGFGYSWSDVAGLASDRGTTTVTITENTNTNPTEES